tara:strand:+ start:16020 stop:16424 length:405 start_codon:yes stop_codon:yes gene_type:complete
MKPILMLFNFPDGNSFLYRQTELMVTVLKTPETNLKISDCTFESVNTLLLIEHDEINTLLDFKNAADYMVYFLDANNFVTGATYALNNSIGYKIQTQSKRLLLKSLKPASQKIFEIIKSTEEEPLIKLKFSHLN